MKLKLDDKGNAVLQDGHSKRVWLNKPESRSTGSVVAFEGMVDYDNGKGAELTSFLELADCHGKVRLHRASYDTRADFVNKMKVLRSVLDDFILYLEGEDVTK